MSGKNSVAGKVGLDPTLPDVELTLQGKTYHLAYDFNAICQANNATGINLLDSILGDITAISLRGLLWAALLPDNPEMTIEEAGKLIMLRDIKAVREAVVTAWFASLPEVKPGEAKARS